MAGGVADGADGDGGEPGNGPPCGAAGSIVSNGTSRNGPSAGCGPAKASG